MSNKPIYEVQFQDQFGNWHYYQGNFSTMNSALVSAKQAAKVKKHKARIINVETKSVEDLLTP